MDRAKLYRWWVVGMLWFVCLFNYADRQAIFSVFPVLKTHLGMNDFELGIVGSSFMWMYALFGPVAGWLGDRFARKSIIIGALVFWSGATAATALCHTFWELTLVRALGGLGEAFYFPAAMSLISDYHSGATRSRAMSLHQSGVYAGTVLGGTLAGFVAQYYGWRWSFVVFGAAGSLLGLVLVALLREPKRGQSEPLSNGRGSVPKQLQSRARQQAVVRDSEREGDALRIREGLQEIFSNRMVAILMMVFIGANFRRRGLSDLDAIVPVSEVSNDPDDGRLQRHGLHSSRLCARRVFGRFPGGPACEPPTRRTYADPGHGTDRRRAVPVPDRLDTFAAASHAGDDGLRLLQGPL